MQYKSTCHPFVNIVTYWRELTSYSSLTFAVKIGTIFLICVSDTNVIRNSQPCEIVV